MDRWKIDFRFGDTLTFFLDEQTAKHKAEAKLRQIAINRQHRTESKEKISRAKTGVKRKDFTDETKAKMKLAQSERRRKEAITH